MDWTFVTAILKGLFWNSHNWLLSIPAYLAAISLILRFFPEWSGTMRDKWSILRKYRFHIFATFALIAILVSSYSAYENKEPRFATPEALLADNLVSLKIRITDLVPVYSDPIVRGKVFENCEFYGPAVVSLHDNNVILGTIGFVTEDGVTADTALLATTNELYIGVIIFDGNIFKGTNKLHNISIIGSPEWVQNEKNIVKESSGGDDVTTIK